MKRFTTKHINWENERDFVSTPPNCLNATVKNDGNSLVRLDDNIYLQPGQAYKVESIAGYFYEDRIKLKTVDTTSGTYTDNTIINIRFSVQID